MPESHRHAPDGPAQARNSRESTEPRGTSTPQAGAPAEGAPAEHPPAQHTERVPAERVPAERVPVQRQGVPGRRPGADDGLRALVDEAERIWLARAQAGEPAAVGAPGSPGWRPFEDAFPTFYQFTNKPR